jgi:NAD+ synthase (glutamine-hydrolysing)
MQNIRVAAAELNQTPMDWNGNLKRIQDAIEAARARKVSILCLPELCLTGYGCEDMFHSVGLQRRAWAMLEKVAQSTHGMMVSVGLPVVIRNGLFNASALLVDGTIAGLVCKQHLASDGLHYETRWFKEWPSEHRLTIERGGHFIPAGDLYFDVGGVKVGFEICEDAWVGPRPGIALAAKGVDIILNPSASHFGPGKIDTRIRFVTEGSRAFGCTYIYSNLLGNEAGRAIYDGGSIVASRGEVFAVGRRFSMEDFRITDAVIDVDATRLAQTRTASFRPYLVESPDECVRIPFKYPTVAPEIALPVRETWEAGSRVSEEEFVRAATLALWDYVRKTRSSGFVVSLSGGADSALCSSLVYLMAIRALHEIGLPNFSTKLPAARLQTQPALARFFEGSPSADPLALARELMPFLLTTAYQATRNSGSVTREAAREVAQALGARHYDLSVDKAFQAYLDVVEGALGYPIASRELGDTEDLALQNLQARVRAPSIWMFANLRNALLVSTSNRSEAMVGYATMDGDTAGGISPIADKDKPKVRRCLLVLEKDGVFSDFIAGGVRIPALSFVNSQQPTAELRDPKFHQTDEDDLAPYPVLDAVERFFANDKMAPVEIFEELLVLFPQHAMKDLGRWTEKILRLGCRNQWKRERYAPSFHLDLYNLDPKTGFRFPILNSGLELELAELREHVAARSRTAA